jgi:phosphatidate phosphatase APP1
MMGKNRNNKPFHFRGVRLSEIPQVPWLEKVLRAIKTFEVLVFKILQILDIYRPQKSIVGLPSLATRNFTLIQAAVYNGSQEEVLGFKPRRLLYRILKGLPDLELFERVRFQLSVEENSMRSVEASTRTRGFIQLQLPWPVTPKAPRASWLRLTPQGVETFLGSIQLGEYEVLSAPVFFLNEKIKNIVISDIDDTIKESNILETTGFKNIVSSIFKGNYYRYEAIEGMSDLYQSLNRPDTLIIYLTSTPFQLTPFLLKFLRDNRFPEGPVFPRWLGYRKFTHKFRVLSKVLSQVERQKVYLVGDSGEEDLQIYRRIAETSQVGKAVEKILIRHVPGSVLPTLKSSREALYSEISALKIHFQEILES